MRATERRKLLDLFAHIKGGGMPDLGKPHPLSCRSASRSRSFGMGPDDQVVDDRPAEVGAAGLSTERITIDP
jgi:hypothetical protein